jgi:hypothetical protein
MAKGNVLFVEIDAVMMCATGVTSTTGMLSVFANSTMTVTDMTSQLSGLLSFV